MHRLILQPHRKYRIVLILGDLFIILASLSIVLYLDTNKAGPFAWSVLKLFAIYTTVSAIMIFALYVFDLYDLYVLKNSEIILFYICLGLTIVTIIYSAMAYFLISLRPGKINLILFTSITVISTYLWRLSFKRFNAIKPQHLLFIGDDPIFKELSQVIQIEFPQHYHVVQQWRENGKNGPRPDLYDFFKDNNIDLIVYSVNSELVRQIADDLITVSFNTKSIIDAYTFYQRLTYKCPLHFLDYFSLLVNANKEIFMPAIASNVKRAFDFCCVLLLSPIALPIFLASALAIKLDSKGPVLFVQERLGQNEVPFRLFKLRTMIHNAERLNGPQWSAGDDPRITRVGKLLRKARMDELPQLYNIFKGDMAVVGPRPIRRHFADILVKEVPFYRLRFLAKPGLTGWAQVNYDYAGSKEGQSEKQQYDLFYLINQSIWLDLFILFKTVKVMVWGKGT